ncbi:MFS general substrate transporter [Daldinia sp. FL1419]|nr:MFS general substrate transporter [Daldinia sp. FL1419]
MPEGQRTPFPCASWTQVLVAFLAHFCTVGLSNSFGAFQTYFDHELLTSFSPFTISWIGTIQGFLANVLGILSGPLYDKGYSKALMYFGTILNVGGILCTSFTGKYMWIFLSFGVAVGIGCGALYVPAQAIVQSYFSEEKAPLPTGISMTGLSVGGILYPIIFGQLVDTIGFSWTCRVLALLNGVLLLVACLLIRPPKARETQDTQNAEEGQQTEDPRPKLSVWAIFGDRKLLLFGFCTLLVNIVVDIPFYFIPTFVQRRLGLSPAMGNIFLAGINASSLFGRIILNWLSTRSTPFFKNTPLITWQITIFGACVMLFCWWLVRTLAGIVVFVIFYGFLVGGLITLIPSSIRELFPDRETIGTRIGLVEAFQGTGFLIGPPIAAAIMDSPSGYLGVSTFCGSLYFVLFLLVGVFTWRRRGPSEETPDEGLELSNIQEETTATRADA